MGQRPTWLSTHAHLFLLKFLLNKYTRINFRQKLLGVHNINCGQMYLNTFLSIISQQKKPGLPQDDRADRAL